MTVRRCFQRALARQQLLMAGLCTVCKQPQPPERVGRQKCLACQRRYSRHDTNELFLDFADAAIERRIAAAYARIQAERRAGLRPGVEQWAWARRYDPLQQADEGADGPITMKRQAQAGRPKAPRGGKA